MMFQFSDGEFWDLNINDDVDEDMGKKIVVKTLSVTLEEVKLKLLSMTRPTPPISSRVLL